jgi:aminoglycoside 2'-N-acetyltransferase I
MHVVSYPEAEVPLDLRLQVVAHQHRAWPSEHLPDPAAWHDPALRPLSVLLIDDGAVLAALDILSKDIVHGGETFAASGLSAAVTDPALRGQGHGARIVEAARRMLEASGADLGIFTCDGYLQAFYKEIGPRVAPPTLIGPNR